MKTASDKLNIQLENHSYPIEVSKGSRLLLANYATDYKKILLISDDNVGTLYSKEILELLEGANLEVFYYEIKNGEDSKTIGNAIGIYDFLIENDFTRDSLIITLGGGVVCDLGGFVASTFLRGIDYIQLPTSLLAQVDASIGGKVAINHPAGKNMIGAFYQPLAVIIDTYFLKTLCKRYLKDGFVEGIKHGMITSEDYLNFIEDNHIELLSLDSKFISEFIKKSCLIKGDIVQKDEKEKNIRAVLNLGHTYGHVLEAISGYKVYSHGEAVAKGIHFALDLASHYQESKGAYNKDYKEQIIAIFKKFGIDSKPIYIEPELFSSTLNKDKKMGAAGLKFILPLDFERSVPAIVSKEDILAVNDLNQDIYIKGAIDLGTNSCRLIVAEVKREGKKLKVNKTWSSHLEIVALGEGVDQSKLLKDEAIKRTTKALKHYKEICKKAGCKEVLAYTTSAVRDVKNREEFMKDIYNQTGIQLECLSGEKEALTTFKGATSRLMDNKKHILLIDIGGGSTEVICGVKEEVTYVKSFDLGALRFTERFFGDGTYNKENIEYLKKHCLDELKLLKGELCSSDYQLIGVAAVVTSQLTVRDKITHFSKEELNLQRISYQDIETNLELFLSLSPDGRGKIAGLHPKRAKTIIAGTIILLALMEVLEEEEITISTYDLLDGIIVTH